MRIGLLDKAMHLKDVLFVFYKSVVLPIAWNVDRKIRVLHVKKALSLQKTASAN